MDLNKSLSYDTSTNMATRRETVRQVGQWKGEVSDVDVTSAHTQRNGFQKM